MSLSKQTKIFIEALIKIIEARISSLEEFIKKENKNVQKLIQSTSIAELKRVTNLLRDCGAANPAARFKKEKNNEKN